MVKNSVVNLLDEEEEATCVYLGLGGLRCPEMSLRRVTLSTIIWKQCTGHLNHLHSWNTSGMHE